MKTRAHLASVASSALQTWDDRLQTRLQTRNSREEGPRTSGPARHPANISASAPRMEEGLIVNDTLRRFHVGVDYGTTFTSVSYYVGPANEYDRALVKPEDIKHFKHWPGEPSGTLEQVPTESWYPTIPLERAPATNQYDTPVTTSAGTHMVHSYLDDEDSDSQSSSDITLDARAQQPDDDFDDEESPEFLWGYDVGLQRYQYNTTRNPRRLIQHPKLMMLDTSYTEGDRQTLRIKIDDLIRRGIIRKYGKRNIRDARDIRDVVADFLARIFEHTKKQLAIYEDFDDSCKIEFAIAVPSIWSPEASRTLQYSMEDALRATSFGTLKDGSIENLFIITEPEGGVTWLLCNNKSHAVAGKTIISLDCGGGTVDAAMYDIGPNQPLRLSRETIEPDGDNCGSSYLNRAFEKHVLHRLRHEMYLECNGITIQSIVSRLIPLFEDRKKGIDLGANPFHRYYIDRLRGDKERGLLGPTAKKFAQNSLIMNVDHYKEIFLPMVKRVWCVLEKQLKAAYDRGRQVNTVFLMGGFAASPTLIRYLEMELKNFEKSLDLPYKIYLVEDRKKCITAVSAGTVLRALSKRNGPSRIAQSSYGFFRREAYEPNRYPGHGLTEPRRDQVDGERYVPVINYFINKTDFIPSKKEYGPFTVYHSFPVDDLDMICEEVLFVCDTEAESHQKWNALTNIREGKAQVAGKVVTDMTFLRKEGLIAITQPTPTYFDVHEVPHYKVAYDLVAIVEGRNLRYEARWPPKNASDEEHEPAKRRIPYKVKFRKAGQVCIAAAFKPGTE